MVDVVYTPPISYSEKNNTPKTSQYNDINSFLEQNKAITKTIDVSNLYKRTFIYSVTTFGGWLPHILTVPAGKIWYLKQLEWNLIGGTSALYITIGAYTMNVWDGTNIYLNGLILNAGDRFNITCSDGPSTLAIMYEELDISI